MATQRWGAASKRTVVLYSSMRSDFELLYSNVRVKIKIKHIDDFTNYINYIWPTKLWFGNYRVRERKRGKYFWRKGKVLFGFRAESMCKMRNMKTEYRVLFL